MAHGRLMAISDLHAGYEDNRRIVDGLLPGNPSDWLLVAGDVGEHFAGVERTLTLLRRRYAQVVWAPGNHDLWTLRDDPVRARGEERYRMLVDLCRSLGVHTPEDPYPVWSGPDGAYTVAPLFVLYDHSFRVPRAATKEEALALAREAGVVCADEYFLHPDPYPGRDAWCRARVAESERRLAATDPGLPTVLVNHYPLVRRPTDVLRHPLFAQWCGTELTADWHLRFRAAAVVYGHLHLPRTTWYDGVRFEEVSLGYPREWRVPGHPRTVPRQILPHVPGQRLAPAPGATARPLPYDG